MPHGDSRVVIHGYAHSLFNRYVSAPTDGAGFLGLITALPDGERSCLVSPHEIMRYAVQHGSSGW